ncbi:MAG: nuclear transport factor 2 family protein [Pigmentiphaga sp.]|nr:nuclear transport factor 2 family protein [Pigmentiphaga sp.]
MSRNPTKPVPHCRLLPGALLWMAAIAPPTWADVAADKAAISQRLQAWATAFNARDAVGACDLFAPDLIATVQGAPDADRDTVCQRLAALLAKADVTARYHPEIQEIIVAGDLAVVRLIWTLTLEQNGEQRRSRETGMDIFQRQADDRWSITRFVAFPLKPDPSKAD